MKNGFLSYFCNYVAKGELCRILKQLVETEDREKKIKQEKPRGTNIKVTIGIAIIFSNKLSQ